MNEKQTIATAVDYSEFLCKQQGLKIEGLENMIRELEVSLIAHKGALRDARNDLERMEQHRAVLTVKEGHPYPSAAQLEPVRVS